ncbi:rod shape-determining protein MreC [Patescibacteria group bacterium]
MRLRTSPDYSAWLPFFVGSLLLLGVDFLGWFSGIRSLGDRLINPLSSGVRGGFHQMAKPIDMIRFMRSGPSKIADLESRYAEALAQLSEVESIKKENESLRKLLGSSPEKGYLYDPVSVVAGNDELILSSGSVSGVEAGEVVVDSSFVLVGRVVRVSPWASWVVTSSYNLTQTPVLIGSLKVSGIMVGDGDRGVVEVEQSDLVSVGNLVITSGSRGNFVPEILVGTVEEVEEESAEVLKKVYVKILSKPGNTVFFVRGDK